MRQAAAIAWIGRFPASHCRRPRAARGLVGLGIGLLIIAVAVAEAASVRPGFLAIGLAGLGAIAVLVSRMAKAWQRSDARIRALEQALAAAERERETLVDSIPTLLWTLTPDGRPCHVNLKLCEWAGIDPARIRNSPRLILASEVCSTLHPEDTSAVMAALGRSLSSGAPFSMRYRQRRTGGDYRWIECVMEAARLSDGSIWRWYGAARDIEVEVRQKQALQVAHDRLATADRAAGVAETSAAIAHEVNQPLMAILGDAGAARRWLDRDPPDIARARRLLGRIEDQAETAGRVVRRTAALVRSEAPERAPVALSGLVEGALRLFGDDWRSPIADVRLEEDLPAVFADAVQIQQVLVNLVRNALEAMPPGRAVAPGLFIHARRTAEGAEIVVADTGHGVEDVGRIFDPFFTTKEGGMGLGLSISRSVIQAHDGRLWVEPNTPKGARFCFTLPFAGALS